MSEGRDRITLPADSLSSAWRLEPVTVSPESEWSWRQATRATRLPKHQLSGQDS